MKFTGIDYSMTSPGCCIYDTKKGIYEHYFFNSRKTDYKLPQSTKHRFVQLPYPDYENNVQRFGNLAKILLETIPKDSIVGIEDYSMGSTGSRVFHIGENTGILKFLLYERGQECMLYAPSVIKKFATGKGNATKNKMYKSWIESEGLDIQKTMKPNSDIIGSPVTDIVDAFFLTKMLISDTINN